MNQPFDDFARRLPEGAFWMTGALMRELLGILIADRVRPGQNLQEIQNPRGRWFDAQAGGGGAALDYPFDLTLSTGDAAAPKARLRPGSCNESRVATNVLETLNVPARTLSYLWIEALTDGQQLQSFQYKTGTTQPSQETPTPNLAPGRFVCLLYLIDYVPPTDNGGSGTYVPYRVFPRGNVLAAPREVLRQSVDNPTPGKLTFDPIYQWEVTCDVGGSVLA